jgi:hypothetical protein
MFRYAEGKWTVKEVIGHLLDTERVFAYRLFRISRGDVTPMPGFDEKSYVSAGEFNLRRVAELVSEFTVQRASTLALVNGVPSTAWLRIGSANGFRTSARALVYIILGHTEHHFDLLKERYLLPAMVTSQSTGRGLRLTTQPLHTRPFPTRCPPTPGDRPDRDARQPRVPVSHTVS